MADKNKVDIRTDQSISRATDKEVVFFGNKGGIIHVICIQSINILKQYNLRWCS